MASRRQVLETLTRQHLLDLAATADVGGLTGKAKADIVDTLVASRSLTLEQVLATLSRDQLKAVCRELGLDDTGKEKQVLIDRLLGAGANPAATSATSGQKAAAHQTGLPIDDYRHETEKRVNIPPAQIASEGTVPPVPKLKYSYSPRRSPVLRFDPTGESDALFDLLQDAKRRPLADGEVHRLSDALRTHEPWLEWAGKQEADRRGFFEVDPVVLHIHERVSAQAILKIAARQDVERNLFGDPEMAYHEAVQFYRHDVEWTNRLILGDSLQVMSSLAHRENLAGKVQMIYIDPPYGIKFASNFQPEVQKRDVGDAMPDLTREAEQVKAYRDTWELGVHSYLSYLRQRLTACRTLLADTGSLFVQIGEENVHRVRSLLAELFGPDNYMLTVLLKKKAGQKSGTIDPINDYILWTAKDRTAASGRFRRLFSMRGLDEEVLSLFNLAELPDGQTLSVVQLSAASGKDYRRAPESIERDFPGVRLLTSGDATIGGVRKNQSVLFHYNGQTFDPGLARGNCWKHTAVREQGRLSGMERLGGAGRLQVGAGQVRIKRYADDFGGTAITNWWDDFGGAMDRVYVVQTNARVIERCILMTTDPGDLVLDPTCGSGTTAYVAEQWGRRWITIDTHCCPVIDLADRCKSLGLQRIGGLAALFDIFGSRHFPAPWGPRRHNAACNQAEASSPS